MNDLLVMKFGGTSMGSADRIKIAAHLASQERKTRPVAIVVSAMSLHQRKGNQLTLTPQRPPVGQASACAGLQPRTQPRKDPS